MPELCRFYGIIIRMFWADHPPPHFHAVYGESFTQGPQTPIYPRQLHLKE